MSNARDISVRGEEKEQWITKTSVLLDPFLFSKRPSFHHRFLLPLLHCFCFLHPVPLSVALPLSSFFLFSLIVVSFSLLLYLSPSLSLRCSPAFSVQLLILSDFTRRTLYKRWVLFWTWSRTASFHTLQSSSSHSSLPLLFLS